MDIFKELEDTLVSVEYETLNSGDALAKLMQAIREKKKFRIQVNGVGGKWVNMNIHTQKNGNLWNHITIHNRNGTRK